MCVCVNVYHNFFLFFNNNNNFHCAWVLVTMVTRLWLICIITVQFRVTMVTCVWLILTGIIIYPLHKTQAVLVTMDMRVWLTGKIIYQVCTGCKPFLLPWLHMCDWQTLSYKLTLWTGCRPLLLPWLHMCDWHVS